MLNAGSIKNRTIPTEAIALDERTTTMAIDRWNPFQEMLTWRDTLDRMLQETFSRTGAQGALPMDVVENDTGYTVHASLPGFKPDEVQVQVTGNTLTIRGEHRAETQPQNTGPSDGQNQGQNQGQNPQYLMRERSSTTVYRSITLPTFIDADKAQAQYENGVLTLTLPRAQSSQPRQIPIAGQSTGQISQGNTPNANGAVQSGNKTRTGSPLLNDVDQASAESFPASDAPSSMSSGTSPSA
jgi:HSP20 family protein